MDSEVDLQPIESNPASSTRRVSGDLFILQSMWVVTFPRQKLPNCILRNKIFQNFWPSINNSNGRFLHHYQVALIARSSLTPSHNPSQSSISSGRGDCFPPVFANRLDNIVFRSALSSPAMSYRSRSSNLKVLRDGKQIAMHLLLWRMLLAEFVLNYTHICSSYVYYCKSFIFCK